MMKHIIFTSALVLVSVMNSEAMAACPTSGQVTQDTNETLTVTFGGALGNNKNVTIGGRTLTNSPGAPNSFPSSDVANAFANGATSAPAGLIFTNSLAANWTSGPVVGGDTVTFTNTTGSNVPDIAASTNDNSFSVTPLYVQGGGTAALSALLTNNTICQYSPEKAQEEHFSGGVLKDYKLGPSHAVDPETTIGSWLVSGSGTDSSVTYHYTGGSSYSYKVYLTGGTLGANGSTYDFCGASTVSVTLKTGTGACP